MSFLNKLSENFGKTIDHSPYVAVDPLVKSNYIARGKNLIFGRSIDTQEFTPSNLMYIGKVYESAVGTSYLGADAWLDTSFPHVAYITGTRGSGKSMDLGILIEGLAELSTSSRIQAAVTPVATFLVDTQSQFWTLRYAPQGAQGQKQLKELDNWNLKPNSLNNAKIYVPPKATKFLRDEIELKLRPRDILHEEWCELLGQEVYSPQGHLLASALSKLNGMDFSIDDIITSLESQSITHSGLESSRSVIIYRLNDYKNTELFDPAGINIEDLLVAGSCNIFMLRDLRDDDKALFTALLARQLFTIMGKYHQEQKISDFFETKKSTKNFPSRVWLLIDEAHVVCPNSGSSPARKALVEYVKRGRDAGLSLVLATQQPSAVDDRVLSQVNLTFSHRLTFQSDINSAIGRIPTKTLSNLRVSGTQVSDFGDMLRLLDAGHCFIGDHSTSRTVLLQMRPRITAHGGQSPI